MKKITAVLMVLVFAASLCGCGNRAWDPGNYEFKKVHIDTYNHSGCLTVEKWYEDEKGIGIEVKTKEAGALFLSEGTYILIEKDCPFCNHPTEKGGAVL